MIEERARVVALDGAYAWLETQRRSACGACSAKGGCGTATIGKVVGRRSARLRVANDLQLRTGEEVIVGLPEEGLLLGSLLLYGLPLVFFVLGAMLGGLFAVGEWASILGGVGGLLAGLALAGYATRSSALAQRCQARIVRRAEQAIRPLDGLFASRSS